MQVYQALIGKRIHPPEATRRKIVAEVRNYGWNDMIQVVFTDGKKALYSRQSMNIEWQFAK